MNQMTSGNTSVDQMLEISFEGNITPQAWYKTILRENGRPHLLAITILSDIVYWYRPTIVRDEPTGQLKGIRKKFRSDALQKSYKAYADLYGESKRSIKQAFDLLESIGVIKREFRDMRDESDNILAVNIMYIYLNVDVLKRLTFQPDLDSVSEGHSSEETDEDQLLQDVVQKNAGGPTKFCTTPYEKMQDIQQKDEGYPAENGDTLLQNFVGLPTENDGTNTETTTEISYGDYHSVNPVRKQVNLRLIDAGDRLMESDTDSEYQAYEAYIRKNIDYDRLIQQYPIEKGLIDEIFRTIVDIVAIPRTSVPVNQTEYPYNVVKSQFMKIDCSDVEYMLESLKKTTTKRSSERNYLITTIYNSHNTKTSHYQGLVSHDMAQGLI